MKYGVLVNKGNKNIGDDIQSYASSLFLPSIDYMVDRETIDTFISDNEEPVAVIMSAWWMHKKWNWPPSKYIYPKLISMHLTNFDVSKKGSPIYDDFFKDIGGEYLKAYGPVGARDLHTLDALQKLDIDSYFSGCVTLTLPKQKIQKPKKEYICLVDLDLEVEAKIKKQIEETTSLDIKVIKHDLPLNRKEETATWNYRKKEVVDLLTIYQNAKCVITRRLHAALPCLAMEVPVFCIFFKTNIRFSPYSQWLHMVTPDEFLRGDYDYDFLNPKPNLDIYKKTRKLLIHTLNEFVQDTKNIEITVDKLVKTTYTENEKKIWQYNLMKDTLNKWMPKSISLYKKIDELTIENKKLKEQIKKLKR